MVITVHSVDEIVDIVTYIWDMETYFKKLLGRYFSLYFCKFVQSSFCEQLYFTGSHEIFPSFMKVLSSGTNSVHFYRCMQHWSVYWFGICSTLHSIGGSYISFLFSQQQNSDFLELNDQQTLHKLCEFRDIWTKVCKSLHKNWSF